MSVRQRAARWQGLRLATALWALFDLAGFESLTGPKTDDWLVRAVGVLVGMIGLSLIVAARRAPGPEARVLGMGSAAGLFVIDCYYAWRETISPMVLLDAAVEAALPFAGSLGRPRRFRVDILRRAAPHGRSHESS